MQPDILLIVCDTARTDAFSPWGGRASSPVLERLAAEGTLYGWAQTPAPWTLPSHASIFSGVLPTEHGIHNDTLDFVDGKPTSPGVAVRSYPGSWLPETLRDRGYRTFAASSNQWITPWGGFDRGFDEFHNLTDRERLPAGRVGRWQRRASRMLGSLDRGGKACFERFSHWYANADEVPRFAFVNMMEVHSPYDPPLGYYPYPFWKRRATYRLSGGSKGLRPFLVYNFGVQEPPTDYVPTIRNLYQAAARYEDALIGRFVEAVLDGGRPTAVVVVSDHGENLGENGMFGHNSSLAETLIHVPLVTWGSGLDLGGPHRVEGVVSLLGLADWIRSVADGETEPIAPCETAISEFESTTKWLPPPVKELIDTGKATRVPPLALRPGIAVRRGALKYVAIEDGEDALFDLDTDPNEERNLLPGSSDAAAAFRDDRDAWLKRRAQQPSYGVGEAAEDAISAHLRELGYID
jgi:arylsulfatase A-like enzyme